MVICFDVIKLEVEKFVKDVKEMIENIFKNYEKEFEVLCKLVFSEISEGVLVFDLVKEYEDMIEKLEMENKILLKMLYDFNKNIGFGFMEEM